MKKTILIVDDDESVRESLDMLLNRDFICFEADSFKKAMGYVQTRQFDCAIVDFNFSKMQNYGTELNGITLIKEIKLISQSTLCILFSGSYIPEEDDKPIYDIYLRKPCDCFNMIDTIKKNLAK